jgi:hypothetical protein
MRYAGVGNLYSSTTPRAKPRFSKRRRQYGAWPGRTSNRMPCRQTLPSGSLTNASGRTSYSMPSDSSSFSANSASATEADEDWGELGQRYTASLRLENVNFVRTAGQTIAKSSASLPRARYSWLIASMFDSTATGVSFQRKFLTA